MGRRAWGFDSRLSFPLMKRLMRPILNRIARLLGITEIQQLLGQTHHSSEQAISTARHTREILRQEMGDLERLISRRSDDEWAYRKAEIELFVIEHTERFTLERLDAVQAALREYSTVHLSALREELMKQLASTRRDIDLVRASGARPETPRATLSQDSIPQQNTAPIDEAMYVALEDHFRGSQEMIRSRQEAYLPYVDGLVTHDYPLIDFGCGRGEWLEVLKNKGIPARGFDSNAVCVDECVGKNLHVVQGDLTQVLSTLADGSVGAITFFQVFEHLPFPVLENVVRECRRVLRPGGVLIAEVPNSENLTVGSSTFWIDPTHERPLHPEVLRFIAGQLGFSRVNGVYSTPLRPEPVLDDSDPVQRVLIDLHRAMFGSADFALIAHA